MDRAVRRWARASAVAGAVLLGAGGAFAQNNRCADATPISFDAGGAYCSGLASNVGATDDGYDFLGIRDDAPAADVWFSFVAAQPDVRITVTAAGASPLASPQFVLLQTDCDPASSTPYAFGSNLYDDPEALSYAYDLLPGQTYYIAVSGADGAEGQFELCVTQESTPAPPAADCASAPVLCGTDAVAVDEIRGNGIVAPETLGDGCFGGGEVSPYWFKFKIDQPGDLVFTITPDDPRDDYDFALYRLVALDDCGDRELVRCMKSGPNVGEPPAEWAPCSAATGLSASSSGLSEDVGCTQVPGVQRDDNFLSPVEALRGDVYALLVHNSSQSGRGFTLDFADVDPTRPATSATFGVTASFEANGISTGCNGARYLFAYTGDRLPGNAVAYEWTFGPGATPATAAGVGPHEVTYGADFSLADVSVAIRSVGGCGDTSATRPRDVVPVVDATVVAAPTVEVDCDAPPGAPAGAIAFAPTPAGEAYVYTLTPAGGGAPIEQLEPVFADLPADTYVATVRTSATCEPVAFAGLVVGPAAPLAFDSAAYPLVNPLACGDAAATALLDDPDTAAARGREYFLAEGDAPPVATPVLVVDLTPGAAYTVVVREEGACERSYGLAVPEAPTGPSVTATTEPSRCDAATGVLAASLVAPEPGAAYEYSVDGGITFQPDSVFADLPAGAYAAVAREVGSTCESAAFAAVVDDSGGPDLDPGDLTVRAPACPGAADGSIAVTGAPAGTAFSLDDGATFAAADSIGGLAPGDYTLVARDAEGCRTFLAVTVPAGETFAPEAEVTGPTCARSADGRIEVVGLGDGYAFALDEVDGGAFRTAPRFDSLDAGAYTLRARGTRAPFCESEPTTVTLAPALAEDEPLDLGAAELRLPYGEPYTLEVGALTGLGTAAEYGYAGVDSLGCTDATCQTVVLVPTASTTLRVTALNEAGCRASGAIAIAVAVGPGVFLPTAFSPDGRGDDANDTWRPRFTAAVGRVRSLRIFDRWGALLYAATDLAPGDPDVGWDGTRMDSGEPVGAGVYVAQVVADVAGRERVVTSDVTLVR